MINRIAIPQIFENMEEATIGEWHKAEGDAVAVGDVLCELITEKATFELEAETAGTVLKIAAPVKSIVPVGFVIAVTGEPGDALPDVAAENAALLERKARAGETEGDAPAVPTMVTPSITAAAAAPAGGGSRIRATPAARRAARDRGIAIEDVAAAYPGKVLSEDDVARYAAEH